MRAALFSILIALLAMFIITDLLDEPAAEVQRVPDAVYEYLPPEEGEKEPAAQENRSDAHVITVRLDGADTPMTMRNYLIGALAAEMPANFEAEALKAQAVAARTYALYKSANRDEKHPGADVCGDFSCCAAYSQATVLVEKWGPDFYINLDRIEAAVDATAGLYLTWENEAILAVFHASSAGSTESCEAVWGTKLPYLVSVSSPEKEDTGSSVLLSWSEFMDTIKAAYPEAEFGDAQADWLSITGRTESGRVAEVSCGGVTIPGMEFRFLFDLRSTDFEVTEQEDGIHFIVSGYGHGVGMSQNGADAMAAEGRSFSEILAHYYPGTRLGSLAIL